MTEGINEQATFNELPNVFFFHTQRKTTSKNINKNKNIKRNGPFAVNVGLCLYPVEGASKSGF